MDVAGFELAGLVVVGREVFWGSVRKAGHIRRYLSGLEHWFESDGEAAAAAVLMRMRRLCVDSKVLDSAREGRA